MYRLSAGAWPSFCWSVALVQNLRQKWSRWRTSVGRKTGPFGKTVGKRPGAPGRPVGRDSRPLIRFQEAVLESGLINRGWGLGCYYSCSHLGSSTQLPIWHSWSLAREVKAEVRPHETETGGLRVRSQGGPHLRDVLFCYPLSLTWGAVCGFRASQRRVSRTPAGVQVLKCAVSSDPHVCAPSPHWKSCFKEIPGDPWIALCSQEMLSLWDCVPGTECPMLQSLLAALTTQCGRHNPLNPERQKRTCQGTGKAGRASERQNLGSSSCW